MEGAAMVLDRMTEAAVVATRTGTQLGMGPVPGTARPQRVAGHISSRTSYHWILRQPERRTDRELQLVVRRFQTLDMSIH